MKKYPSKFRSGILALMMLCFISGNTQESDNKAFLDDFRGSVGLTNNGISLVPSFSLGDPAVLLDLKFIRKKLSFEPDMRFSMEGKPWAFLFWFRYKAIEKKRFSLRIGAHPALNFRTVNVIKDGIEQELIQSRRYLAAEIVPNYKISDKVSIRIYNLYSRGFDEGVKEINFLVLNAAFNKIYIAKELYFNWSPQAYFLKSDDLKGYYVASFTTLGHDNFPVSISSILNKAIDTEILPENDFTWNISLNYRFGGNNISRKLEKL